MGAGPGYGGGGGVNHLATAIGLALGIAAGLLAAVTDLPLLDGLIAAAAPLGTLFINAIRMVAIPLVVATIFVGVAGLGSPGTVGRLGGSALGFFWGTTIAAIVIGIVLMQLVLGFWPVSVQVGAAGEAPPQIPGLLDFFLGLVPANPFAAASEGALLPLIVFTVLVATAAGALAGERRSRLIRLAEDVSAMFVRLIDWILWTAPVGVFGLTAPVIAELGLGLLASLLVFVVTVIAGLFVFMALFYLPLVRFVGGKGVAEFVPGMVGTYTIGFSTTSSVASLPVMFEDADNLGVSPTVASLVLSLGAAINRAGSALFQGAAVVLLAALSGIPLSAATLVGRRDRRFPGGDVRGPGALGEHRDACSHPRGGGRAGHRARDPPRDRPDSGHVQERDEHHGSRRVRRGRGGAGGRFSGRRGRADPGGWRVAAFRGTLGPPPSRSDAPAPRRHAPRRPGLPPPGLSGTTNPGGRGVELVGSLPPFGRVT